MSQERVREILSHVDMSKIDLSSFKIGAKKFNELSHLYRNRVIISCVSMVVGKDKYPKDQVGTAFEMLAKVVENPNIYDYDTIYANERKAIDAAINDITTRRDRNINDVKLKAIEKRMKDAYKQMRKTIELALENGNTFKDEFDEELVARCVRIAKEAIEDSRRNTKEARVEEPVAVKPQVVKIESEAEVNCSEDIGPNETEEKVGNAPKAKVGFWKRIFSRA